jgi:uncharacterized protein (TIGR02145 family)
MKTFNTIYIILFLGILVHIPTIVFPQNAGVFTRNAEEEDKANNSIEAVFFAAKALQRSDDKAKITNMKDILNRRFEESIKSAEDNINQYKTFVGKFKGDSAVMYYQNIYNVYKKLLRNMDVVKEIPEQSLPILKKGDIDLNLEARDYLSSKIDAKKRLVKAKEEAAEYYFQEALKLYQSEKLEQKVKAIDIFQKALKHKPNHEQAKQSIEIVKGQIAIIYIKDAEDMMKKGGLENIQKVIDLLHKGFDYAPKEEQKDIILERLAYAERYVFEQKAEIIYQEALKISQSDKLEDLQKAIQKFEEIEKISPNYKDSEQKISTINQKIAFKYLSLAKEMLAKTDAKEKAVGWSYLLTAQKMMPDNTEIIALYDAKKDEMESSGNTLVDVRDGNVYQTIEIGGKVWMLENLKYKINANDSCFINEKENALTEKENFCQKYGVMYKSRSLWDKVNSIVPEGWHIATEQEWDALITSFGGYAQALAPLQEKLNIQLPEFNINNQASKVARFFTSTKFAWNNYGERAFKVFQLGGTASGNILKLHDGTTELSVFIRCVKN